MPATSTSVLLLAFAASMILGCASSDTGRDDGSDSSAMHSTEDPAEEATARLGEGPWVVYEGGDGPGKGKHIVLLAGDEEYRSEEALPQLGKILSVHHGFTCTVLFSINQDEGTIDPNNSSHLPGLRALENADMMIIAYRFRAPSDDDMKFIDDFVHSGKPILGMRTATHAFSFPDLEQTAYPHYHWQASEWPGGFGQHVLGETWVAHHGGHKTEATRGIINPDDQDHPILRGVEDIFGRTDVYAIKNLTDEANVLVHGQVLQGMEPDDPPVEGTQNDPMMPLVWTRPFTGDQGITSKIICTTMGSADDLLSEGLRRVLINACYWGLNLQDQIPERSNVDIVGVFHPTFYGSNEFVPGIKPADLALEP